MSEYKILLEAALSQLDVNLDGDWDAKGNPNIDRLNFLDARLALDKKKLATEFPEFNRENAIVAKKNDGGLPPVVPDQEPVFPTKSAFLKVDSLVDFAKNIDTLRELVDVQIKEGLRYLEEHASELNIKTNVEIDAVTAVLNTVSNSLRTGAETISNFLVSASNSPKDEAAIRAKIKAASQREHVELGPMGDQIKRRRR